LKPFPKPFSTGAKVSVQQKLTILFILGSLALSAINAKDTGPVFMFVSAVALFAFLNFLERDKNIEVDKFKARIEVLEDKIKSLFLMKGMGK
jgi:hypothetical protein